MTYEANKEKSYSLLWLQCSKQLQHKIQNQQDYLSIKNDPIKLLKSIEILSLTYEENRYDVQIIDDALKNLINIKQKDDESLIDYTAGFESLWDIAVAHLGGPIVLLKIVENDTSSTTISVKFKTNKNQDYIRNINWIYFGTAWLEFLGWIKSRLNQ